MKVNKLSLVISVLLGLGMSQQVLADISGMVFRDLPVNGSSVNTYGSKEANELGVVGVTVTAQPDNLTTTTASDGSWSLATTTDSRIEFSAWSNYLYESADGGVANSSVQFVADNTTVNFGLHNPADYSEINPRMSTTELISGDPLGGGTASNFDAWFLFHDDANGVEDNPLPDVLGSISHVGSVWGVAYQKSTQTVFTSAVLRRHSGFGSIDGTNTTTGGIYAADISGAAPYATTPWLDVNTLVGVDTGADPRDSTDSDNQLYANAEDPSIDLNAFALVGKIGLGDTDVSEDDTKLYTINLNSKELLIIDIASKALDSKISIPDPGCSNGDYRPWAIEEHDGELYVGVTCSAETSQNANDLAIHVMKLAGSTFTSVFSETAMNYSRGFLTGSVNSDFGPWRLNWNDLDNQGGWPTMDPAPILSDIEIDIDGSLILGINDITGMQIGAQNNKAISGDTSTGSEGISGGDILRACPNGSGGWDLESAGSCGGVTGFSGTEFYDDTAPASGNHQEVTWGGLGFQAGSGRVSASGFDTHTNLRSGGIVWLSNTDGSSIKGYEIYDDALYSGAEYSKSMGIGDVELLTDSSPLEIGNRVWDDANGDGIQDADEAGIDGIDVVLNCGAGDITQTTANGGQYSFSNVPEDTDCTITVPATEPSGKPLTAQTAAVDDLLGSNPDATGSFSFRTGFAGQNNHSYDIGYGIAAVTCTPKAIDNTATITAVTQTDIDNTNDSATATLQVTCDAVVPINPDLKLVKVADKTEVLKGDTLVYTLVLTNEGGADATGIEITDQLPAGVTHVSHDPNASYDFNTGVWTVSDLAAGASVTLTITVTID